MCSLAASSTVYNTCLRNAFTSKTCCNAYVVRFLRSATAKKPVAMRRSNIISNQYLVQRSDIPCSDGHYETSELPLLNIPRILSEFESRLQPRFRYPDFIGPIKVELINKNNYEQRRSGVFVTENVRPGQLLYATKAVEFVFNNEVPTDVNGPKPYALGSERLEAISEELVKKIQQRVEVETKICHDIIELYYTAPGLRCPAKDELVNVDESMIRTVIQKKAFGYCYDDEENSYRQRAGYGLWLLRGLTNHSCVPNALQTTFGNLVFVRAGTSIAAGTQVCLSYVRQSDSLLERQNALTEIGYVCQCPLCEYEKKHNRSEDIKRDEFLDKYTNGLAFEVEIALEESSAGGFPKHLQKELEKLVNFYRTELACQYRSDHNLFDLLMTLANVYVVQSKFDLALTAYLRAYDVMHGRSWLLRKPKVFFDSFLNHESIVLALQIADAYSKVAEPWRALIWHEKAQQACEIYYGTGDRESLITLAGYC